MDRSSAGFRGRLTLCADDYALSSEISGAIIDLAQRGKINAVSCMAVSAAWPIDCLRLRWLPASVQVGLHLVLSGERPLTSMPRLAPLGRLPHVDTLTRRSFGSQLPIPEIRREIEAQFERFSAATGRLPDFVDGHQHVHCLPKIRHVVLDVTAARAPSAWLRDCTDSLSSILRRPFRQKAAASGLLSAGFASAARKYGLRCNTSFAGHYDFGERYSELFPRFLVGADSHHLVMCHPGAGRMRGDEIADARLREAEVLKSLAIDELASRARLRFSH